MDIYYTHITQVLSESVSKALKLTNETGAEETSKFIEYMDKFFDTLNVSNFTSGKTSRKPFQNPYRSDADFRITVSMISTTQYYVVSDMKLYNQNINSG